LDVGLKILLDSRSIDDAGCDEEVARILQAGEQAKAKAAVYDQKYRLKRQAHYRKIADAARKHRAQWSALLQWHTLGDEWCTQHGVKLRDGFEVCPVTPLRFAKDWFGFVHLDGAVRSRDRPWWYTQSSEEVCTLPEGYRHQGPRREHFTCKDTDVPVEVETQIKPSGEISVHSDSLNRCATHRFSHITYFAE